MTISGGNAMILKNEEGQMVGFGGRKGEGRNNVFIIQKLKIK